MFSRLLDLLTRQFPEPGVFQPGPRGPYLHRDEQRQAN